MPRFTALPITVEAHQFTGATTLMPEAFIRAIPQHREGGAGVVQTARGLVPIELGDWIMRGAGGDFTVMSNAAFEAAFQEQVAESERVKRPYHRKEHAHV